MIKKALSVLTGNALASLLLLMRNLVAARLLTVEDYGIAMTLALIVTFIEMVSALGLQQLIVQSPRGEDRTFQAALQGFQILRGLIAAVILFLSAGMIAIFFGTQEVTWGYRAVAVVPVLYSLIHFDLYRLSRSMSFKAMVWTNVISSLVGLLSLYPIFLIVGDWTTMLWSIILQAASYAAVSHFLAERAWTAKIDIDVIRSTLPFSLPVLANGIIVFASLQMDKFLVASMLDLRDFAIFSLGLTLSLTPFLIISKSIQNLYLPRLAKCAGTEGFVDLSVRLIRTFSAFTVCAVTVTFLWGDRVVLFIVGGAYFELSEIIFWFVVCQGVRFLREGPVLIALAVGNTSLSVRSNLLRCAAMPAVSFALFSYGSLNAALYVMIFAELVASLGAFLLLMKSRTLAKSSTFLPAGLALAIIFFFSTLALG